MPRKKGARKTSSNIGGAGTTIAKSIAEQAAGLTGPAIDWVEEKIYPQDPEHPYESFSKRNPGATGAISTAAAAGVGTAAYLLFRKYREWSKKNPDRKKISDKMINKQPKAQLPPPSQNSQGTYTQVNQNSSSQFTTVSPSEVDLKNDVYHNTPRGGFNKGIIIM